MSTLERLERANPVADPDRLLSAPGAMDDFVLAVKQRSGIVQTAEDRAPIEVAPETKTKPPSRNWRRRLVPALVAASAVIAAIVVAVALLSGDDEPDVTNEPSPTETTTAADVIVASEITVVMSSYEAMNKGDIDGYLALFTEEAAGRERRDLLQVLVNMNEQSELAEPCRLIEPTPGGEARVSCTATFSNDFHGPGGLTATLTETFVVSDAGEISLRFTVESNFGPSFAFNAAFWEWLMVAHPEIHADIAPHDGEGLPGAEELRGGPDDMLVALEYVNEFVAQSDDYPVNQ